MSLEDPFFVVKDEVQKAVQTARGLYTRWCELLDDPNSVTKEEYDWTLNELRNSIRSIEWDLDDLEETIGIVEKNPRKFKIDDFELRDRRTFVERMKATVQEMKDHIASPSVKSREDAKTRQSLLGANGSTRQDRYTRLDTDIERGHQRFIDDTSQQQQLIIRDQDENLDRIGGSVSVLKTMSRHIGSELEEQNRMLDEFGHEMEVTETRMDQVMKKMAKVMHMSNDRRQWCAIGGLVVIMIIVIILFFVL